MTKSTFRSLLQRTWSSRSGSWNRFARYLTYSRSEADDVISEAMLKTIRAAPDLKTERETDNYVLRAIHTTFFSRHARQKARRRAFEKLRLEIQELAPSPLQRVLEAEKRRRLWSIARCVRSEREHLKPELRQALEFYYDRGLVYREIAELQNVSATTAHARVQQALDILSKAIPDEDDK